MVAGRTALPGYINGARREDAGSEAIVVAVHSGKCGFPGAHSGGAGRDGKGRGWQGGAAPGNLDTSKFP